ncbi:MAG TPA: hypothetical protein VM492_17525 [Sumerlaeia bacterium]|nr:hypothetical protein [Sumerlaeia bacterium]
MSKIWEKWGVFVSGSAALALLSCARPAQVPEPEAGAEPPLKVIRARKVDAPPRVETHLSGPKAGEPMRDFADGATGKPAAAQTSGGVFYDDKNLYLVLECLEPQMSAVLTNADQDGQVDVFGDDVIEILISPEGARGPYYHFAVTAAGVTYKESFGGPFSQWNPWRIDWTAKAAQKTDRWTAEVAIPVSGLAATVEPGSVWRMNVCRQRRAGGETELSAWSPTGTSFHRPDAFALLLFEETSRSDDDLSLCLTKNVVEPWDRRADELRAQMKAEEEIAGRFERQLKSVNESLKAVRQAARSRQPLSRGTFAALYLNGQRPLAQLDEMEEDIKRAITKKRMPAEMRKMARPGQELIAYPVRAVAHRKILPVMDPPERISDAISLRACRGEYEPASFVVYPLERDMVIRVAATNLRGPGGALPASVLDVRSVKRWYQSGSRGITNEGVRILLPELLLKDDDLIQVDHEKKANHVRLDFPDGRTEWKCVSNEAPGQRGEFSADVCPIRDAKTLRPVTVPKQTLKQFWLTVHVPERARPGKYTSRIKIRSGGRTLAKIPLELEVLPFDLGPNPLESSVYFHWGSHLDLDGPGDAHFTRRNPAQYRWELENLLAHGIDNPTVGVDFDLLPTLLKMRADVGMKNDHLYYLTAYTYWTSAERAKEIIKVAKEFGFSDVYFYARDEARGQALKQQRPDFEKIHAAGGKVFVAGYVGSNFPHVGDLQDLLVCAGHPTTEEAARWHSKGHKIFCYSNPQAGVEDPEVYRRNYGLLLDAADYDGGMTYIYHQGWNDFNIKPWRQHNFIYPTVDGGIDTIQWEGYREGIDDLRYLATLRKAIADAEASGDAEAPGDADKKSEAQKAKAFLQSMDVRGDLYETRAAMIDAILRLLPEGK